MPRWFGPSRTTSRGTATCAYVSAATEAVLGAARGLGVRAARLVRYLTSGDVSGDLTRVVGYAGLVLE